MRVVTAMVTLLLAMSVLAQTAQAGVRVEEDEVIFTVNFPGAQEVYLVGDFNNWNATVEKMPRAGDTFEISLFLVEGTYYYKYVVDGNSVVDPDNPGNNPERGSPLILIERGGGLVLSTEAPVTPESGPPPPTVTPEARYIGSFARTDGDNVHYQQADLFLHVERERLTGMLDLATSDPTWQGDFDDVEYRSHSGWMRLDLGWFDLTAFDSEAIWDSSDPLSLVGNEGVFDYNAGYDRAGVAMEARASKASLRASFSDDIARDAPPDAAIPSTVVTSFAGATSPDTTIYASSPFTGDADQLAVDAMVEPGDFALGVAHRSNLGMYAGVQAQLHYDTLLTADVFRTREERRATVYWLRAKRLPLGTRGWFAYGRADARLRRLGHASATGPGEISAVLVTEEVDERIDLITSNRLSAGLEGTISTAAWVASWEVTDFDLSSVLGPAEARRQRASVGIAGLAGRLGWRGAAGYVDQDYGDTPPTFLFEDPRDNVWLDRRDDFDETAFSTIDRRSYVHVDGSVVWSNADTLSTPAWGSSTVSVDGMVVVSRGSAEHWRTRALVEQLWRKRFYVQLDGRLASYRKSTWTEDGTFASGWAEVGVRTRNLTVNIGWGFDPTIFDFVLNEFNRIGYLSEVRTALGAGIDRTTPAAVGERVIEAERRMEADNSIRLECIVSF